MFCFGCCGKEEESGPDPSERRHLQAAAAEKRLKDQESRGVKDPGRLKRQQEQVDKYTRLQTQRTDDPPMRWQVG